MRIPQQVSDRVKEAPAQALRAVFAGIGQVLLVADRMKTRAAEANRARPDTAAPPARPAPSPAPGPNGAATVPGKTAADKTAADKTAADKAAADKAVPEDEPAAAPAAAAASVLPVPNYDGLTVASLRARLRNLDSPELRVLIDYEKAHAGRTDVVAMFERRIAKLESGET